jgi:3-deoxy-manno-octulosonate cytidylyltransferase (CMP-KDO synthetase)
MKAIAIIPARLASTRLPRKVLREIAGVPMVGRVYAAASAARGLAEVLVATDSDEVFSLCRDRGWNACMTSRTHRSGTERVHEVAQAMPADVYINVQGDEPLARPEHITALLSLMARSEVQVGTLKTRAGDKDVYNPNAVKVVTDSSGRALYFSRAAIPPTVTAPAACITGSTSAFTPTARQPWTGSWLCPSRRWRPRSGWSSCDSWRMA